MTGEMKKFRDFLSSVQEALVCNELREVLWVLLCCRRFVLILLLRARCVIKPD